MASETLDSQMGPEDKRVTQDDGGTEDGIGLTLECEEHHQS